MRNLLVLLAILAACQSNPAPANDARVAAASLLTERYSESRLANWDMQARAAGSDCSILVVKASTVLDDSIVEAIHYGAGPYGVNEGGVKRFSTERAFRAVAYKDVTGRFWTYGVSETEAASLVACR